MIDVGLLHHLEELPRVGRKRLDVTALALGINGVEGERGFPRPGQAGEYDQPVARNGDVYIFEVVFARTADRDLAGVAGGLAGAVGHETKRTKLPRAAPQKAGPLGAGLWNVVRTMGHCQCAASITVENRS